MSFPEPEFGEFEQFMMQRNVVHNFQLMVVDSHPQVPLLLSAAQPYSHHRIGRAHFNLIHS